MENSFAKCRKYHGKRMKCWSPVFYTFSHNVFYPSQNKFQFLRQIYFVVFQCSQILSNILLFGDMLIQKLTMGCTCNDLSACLTSYFIPFPNKPLFLHVCITSLLKTLWEKEKLLVMSNFSFSHNVFCPFEKHSAIFIKFEFVVCKLFQFGPV